MSPVLEALDAFLRRMGHTNGSGVLMDTEFRETAKRALASVESLTKEGRVRFVTAPVISVLLSAFYVKKTRVVEAALSVLQQLLHHDLIFYDTPIILYQSTQNKQSMRCGEALFFAVGDFLAYTTDAALQLKALELLHELVSDDKFTFFTGGCITRCMRICFQLTLQSSNEGTRGTAHDLLLLCVLRVTRAFVETPPSERQSGTFASSTVLYDYMHDVEPDARFTPIQIEGYPTTPLEDEGNPLDGSLALGLLRSYATEDTSSFRGSLRQSERFSSSLDDSIRTGVLSVVQADGTLPIALKDFLWLIRHICKLASRTCRGSGSTSEKNPEVRVRQLALETFEAVLLEIPPANCDAEHPCAAWLTLVMAAAKYDILRCIARNLSTIVPSSLFSTGVRILRLLLQKCHYHLARELHALLAVMLFPLALSKFSNFSQKRAVLSMVHELVSIPHLCVSFFINYDCDPNFDAAAKYGGMLELLVDFIVEMTYTDFVEPDWLSLDQQQLLRSECANATHNLVQSMLRWVSEDPRDYVQRQMRESVGQALRKSTNGSEGITRWHEVYLSKAWEAGGNERRTGVSKLSLDVGTFSSSSSSSTDAREQPQMWGEEQQVGYHWKHIHYLLHNKRIAQEAMQQINKGHWREGMRLLELKGYISHTGESNKWTEFARFLKTYPGIERSALCAIFERVLKDPDCDRILQEYMHLFPYKGVPIDIALRDTTCEFMSWDRPSFEAQVWAVIQRRFGEAYEAQNVRSITAKDANVMAGVLLFLHTSLHNESMRGSRMTIEEFVRNGNECIEFPFAEQDMRDMYHRVAQQKWELDELQRTPRQVELERKTPSLSTRMAQQQGGHFSLSDADPAMKEALSFTGRNATGRLKGAWVTNDGPEDSKLLNSEVVPYTTDPDGFKLRESYQQRYVDVATQHLRRLECEHRMQRLEACVPQPYIVPHYAQHVRPMLLMLYPQIAAMLYMGFRVLEEQPISRILLGTYDMLYDVAAAFVVNLSGLRVAVERKIQCRLGDEDAQHLLPPTRGAFTLPLMNLL
ncbi:hypothetical protein TraAM80_01216 [Trypanosoma rangeli]|uniref:SEC7 domain-containing protein n=1 Tax=Trypanosoma rangeli TaxID=5698 RepID=A0A3R7LBD7_TRYRA|nr:uncharacterized protein TraAM80_01216 [Trypanosoma rangeli]RNF10951.1 hypothetical protein TraAM80_01216 [Trypanosoma rangeli]|eukprot:RNF10951.1 hypothetical protein TraAM80_01216 [Trypanosoma rangeli]